MNRLLKKYFLVVPAIAILVFSAPSSALAGVPTVDWSTLSHYLTYLLKEFGLDGTGRVIAQVAFNVMTDQIISKAQKGGRNGGAAFIQNWRNYQTEAQYRGEDVFRAIAANTKFCGYLDKDIKSTFRISDKFKISLSGQNIRTGDLDPYTLRARCTLPANFDIAKYQKDFGGNGGWAAFIRMLEPQNNPYGSQLLAQDELEKQRELELSSDLREAQTGEGYVSSRVNCTKNGIRCTFLGNIKSPGNILSESVKATVTKELDWLTSSDELEDTLASLLTNLVLSRIDNLATAGPASTQNNTDTITDKNLMMEYCTARKPRAKAVERFQSKWDPYGRAAQNSSVCKNAKKDNPYPYQECVRGCLEAVGYHQDLPGTITPPDESDLADDSEYETGDTGKVCQGIDVNGPVCKDGRTSDCRAYCIGSLPGAPEGCGSFTNGSAAYLLAAGHLSLDVKSNKLFNPGNSGSSDYRDWEWFRAPDISDVDSWCEPDRLQGTSPPSQAPTFPALARCADGSTGGLEPLPGCFPSQPGPSGPPGPNPTSVPSPGQCQRELPAGQTGPYGGDIQSVFNEIANSGSGILDKNDTSGGAYKILNFEAYMGEVENKLRGRGYVFVRRDTNDTREMMMKRSDSEQYAQQYNLARTGDYTRIAHKGLNCTP